MYFGMRSFSGKSVGMSVPTESGRQRAGTDTDPIADRNFTLYSSFASAKLAGVKGVKRSYRPPRWAKCMVGILFTKVLA